MFDSILALTNEVPDIGKRIALILPRTINGVDKLFGKFSDIIQSVTPNGPGIYLAKDINGKLYTIIPWC